MATTLNEANLLDGIKRAVQQEIDRAVEVAVEETIQKVRESVRKRLGEIAIGLLGEYDLFHDRQNIHIVIKAKTDI